MHIFITQIAHHTNASQVLELCDVVPLNLDFKGKGSVVYTQLANEVTAAGTPLISSISIPAGEALVDLHLAYQKTRDMRRQV